MEVAPEYVEGDQDVGSAMQLLVPHDENSGNTLRFLNRLQELGYEVSKEHATEHQTVYNVYPKPDRDNPANRLTPSKRGEVPVDG